MKRPIGLYLVLLVFLIDQRHRTEDKQPEGALSDRRWSFLTYPLLNNPGDVLLKFCLVRLIILLTICINSEQIQIYCLLSETNDIIPLEE